MFQYLWCLEWNVHSDIWFVCHFSHFLTFYLFNVSISVASVLWNLHQLSCVWRLNRVCRHFALIYSTFSRLIDRQTAVVASRLWFKRLTFQSHSINVSVSVVRWIFYFVDIVVVLFYRIDVFLFPSHLIAVCGFFFSCSLPIPFNWCPKWQNTRHTTKWLIEFISHFNCNQKADTDHRFLESDSLDTMCLACYSYEMERERKSLIKDGQKDSWYMHWRFWVLFY